MSLPLFVRLLEKLFLALDGISKNVIPISLIPSLKRDQVLFIFLVSFYFILSFLLVGG